MTFYMTEREKRAFSNPASYIKEDFHYVSSRELKETIEKKVRAEDKLKYQPLFTPTKEDILVHKYSLNANGKREVKKALPRRIDGDLLL